jgi:hypothetical protein
MPPGSHEARWRHGLLLLSTAAGIRAFCIGLTGVLLGLYLARRGYTAGQLGVVVGCGLAGNAVATAWLALAAPRVDRRAVLLVSTVLGGAGLIGAGNVSAPLAIAVVAFVGLVNGMGRDRGPAQVLEQSLLSDRLPISDGARVMVRYTATPAPKDPTRPCDRHLLDNWLRRAFPKAGLKQEAGGLWHTLRRKWATERKGYPVKAVAAAGGWRDERTILTSYQQADAATVKQVVLHPTQRLVSG